jgi:dolichol-phosphate mannosyltransferase
MSLISIVVPVYHNAKSLPELLKRFQLLAAQNSDDDFDFIFVNDGSRDNSYEVLQDLSASEPRIQIVNLSRNFGSNAAIMAGLSRAAGDAVAVISADLQDPPELIHEMLQHWRQGHKVVLAAREQRDDSSISSFMADMFYRLFRKFAINSMPKRGFDFFVIDQQVCSLINMIQEQNPYLMGLILWLGFKPKTIYYHRLQREARFGRSMWTFTKKLKYFVDAFVAFSYTPIRIASILGIIFSCLGFIYAAVVVIMRLAGGIEIEGWTSLMIVLLVVSGIQMLMIGILGEYIWRILDESRKRPPFIVESVSKKTPASSPSAQDDSTPENDVTDSRVAVKSSQQ